MKKNSTDKRDKNYWIRVLIIILIPISWDMHRLYGLLHLPNDDFAIFVPHVMDRLYIYSVGFALAGVCLSIYCIVKKQFVFGVIALVVSIAVLGNGIIMF